MHLTYTNNIACAHTYNRNYTLHAAIFNSISSHSFSIVCSAGLSLRYILAYNSAMLELVRLKTLSCLRLLFSSHIWLLLWTSLVTANEQPNQFSTRSISERLGLCASLLSFFVFRRALNIIGIQKVSKL